VGANRTGVFALDAPAPKRWINLLLHAIAMASAAARIAVTIDDFPLQAVCGRSTAGIDAE
jgi:hypothetical protein